MAERAPWIFLFLMFLLLAGLLLAHWGKTEAQTPPQASTKPKPVRVPGVPQEAVRAYQRAGERSGVSWKLLLALGGAESNHGRSPLPGVRSGINSADCCAGPMQLCVRDFCGNVASVYARDGEGDGSFSVYDIDDAAATAANYLRWMQGRLGTRPAILAAAYNAGPTVVGQEGIPDYPETRAYVQEVRKTLRRLG